MKVISYKNIPSRLPLSSTVLYWLVLDYYKASPIFWGVFFTVATVLWLAAIVGLFTEERTDIL
jgi:hypothetical protein